MTSCEVEEQCAGRLSSVDTDDEDDAGMTLAYSVTDMLDALDDSEHPTSTSSPRPTSTLSGTSTTDSGALSGTSATSTSASSTLSGTSTTDSSATSGTSNTSTSASSTLSGTSATESPTCCGTSPTLPSTVPPLPGTSPTSPGASPVFPTTNEGVDQEGYTAACECRDEVIYTNVPHTCPPLTHIVSDIAGRLHAVPEHVYQNGTPEPCAGGRHEPIYERISGEQSAVSPAAFIDSAIQHVRNSHCMSDDLASTNTVTNYNYNFYFPGMGSPGNPFLDSDQASVSQTDFGCDSQVSIADPNSAKHSGHDVSVSDAVSGENFGDVVDIYSSVEMGRGEPQFVEVALEGSSEQEEEKEEEKKEEHESRDSAAGDSCTYENMRPNQDDSSEGWCSSEFETYEECEESPRSPDARFPTLPPRNTPQTTSPRSSESSTTSSRRVFDKLAARLSVSRLTSVDTTPDESPVVEVDLDWNKHPPPELPPAPGDLQPLELKRRLIVSSIVESENSYTASLRNIIEDYERPLTESRPAILGQDSLRVIFHKVRDILQCHLMFRIELAEAVRLWDTQPVIGNIFTASFSKSIVFDVYSAFLINFSVAMDTVKKQAQTKQAFADFLKKRRMCSANKLSLFALMVKPVQRFPQFIMLLQDLLKNTPQDHEDRLSLQIALTELEAMTHKLNETKRESESCHEARTILSRLLGRNPLKQDKARHLVRQDDVVQVKLINGEQKSKTRRLFLFSDLLLCTSLSYKDGESGEKLRYKWSVPLSALDVVHTPVTSTYKVQINNGTATIHPLTTGGLAMLSMENPHKDALDDLLHDMPLLENLAALTTQLRLKYQGLSADHILGLMKSVQLMVQQKSDLDRGVIKLSLPAKGTKKTVHTFKVEQESTKQNWLLDLNNTKLALDPNNLPGWSVPENQQLFSLKLPLFIKPLLLDITKQETRVQCAVPVLLPQLLGASSQHLWVCSGQEGRGQVTVVSLHGQQPHVVESFSVADSVVVQAALVPAADGQDTVWMATKDCRLLVYDAHHDNEERGEARMELRTAAMATCMQYSRNRLYVGLVTGDLVIYTRHADGLWSEPVSVALSPEWPVSCLLLVHHTVWAGAGHQVTAVNHLNDVPHLDQHTVVLSAGEGQVRCLATAGVGLVVSYSHKPVIRLYHLETFQHLQDISVASAIKHMLQGRRLPDRVNQPFTVTCMMSCRGLLWLGTSIGCVLSFPLPRLEGVPQIKGRPTVAHHAHSGPVKFLSCTQNGGWDSVQCETPEPVPQPSVEPVVSSEQTRVRHTMMAGLSSSEESELCGLGQRWTSTPDLRPQDSVQELYGSLLQDCNEDMEQELVSNKRHRRSVTSHMNRLSEAVLGRIATPPQASTLPTDAACPVTPAHLHFHDSLEVSQPKTEENGSVLRSDKTVIPSYPAMIASQQSHSKRAMVVVSGGEGHINWNDPRVEDSQYDDICLLLWQCRL